MDIAMDIIFAISAVIASYIFGFLDCKRRIRNERKEIFESEEILGDNQN